MSIVKRSTFPLLGDRWGDFFGDQVFPERFFSQNEWPAVNIKETDKAWEIEAMVPGIKKEDIQVELHNGMLTISGKGSQEENQEEKGKFTRREFRFWSFNRSFGMPNNITEEDIAAAYTDGILKLQISKKGDGPNEQKKKIVIK